MNFFLLSLPLGQSFYQDETKTISMADEGGIRNASSAHILMTFTSSAIVNRFSCSKDRFGSSEDRKIAVKGHCSTVSQWIMSFPTSEQVHRFILVRLQSLPLPLPPPSTLHRLKSNRRMRVAQKRNYCRSMNLPRAFFCSAVFVLSHLMNIECSTSTSSSLMTTSTIL